MANRILSSASKPSLQVAVPLVCVTAVHSGFAPTLNAIDRPSKPEPPLVRVALTFPMPTPIGGGKITSCGAAVRSVCA